MKHFIETFPLFLFLLPVFVIVHLEKELSSLTSYRFVLDRIFIFFAVPVILFLLIFLMNKSVKKAALTAVTLSVPFFYTGEIKNWLSYKFPSSVFQSYIFIVTAILVLLIIILYRIHKTKSAFRVHFQILNTGLLLFIATDILSIFIKKDKYIMEATALVTTQPCPTCEKPDIFYILLDTYTSSSILQSNFNYQNSLLEQDLRRKGFFIANSSVSNYNYTAFSLGSIFNMNYIKDVDTVNKIFDRDYLQALKLVQNNQLYTFLEKEGYDFFNHSPFDINSHLSTIRNFDCWGFMGLYDQFNIFLNLNEDLNVLKLKWLNKISRKQKYYIYDPGNIKRYDSLVYRHLNESIKFNTGKPKFVYAHFLSPHPPYITDSIGNIFKDLYLTKEETYIHQIAYCNRIIKKITDTILTNTKRPLVIIIQGDHGFQLYEKHDKQKEFAVFHAAYFSNHNYSFYSDSINSVNTFRVILNTFFKTNYPLLEPRKYYLH